MMELIIAILVAIGASTIIALLVLVLIWLYEIGEAIKNKR